MLGLRLLIMVLSIICLMDGHAEVSSSTTGIRNGGESPVVKPMEPEVGILDRKKKKSKKSKKSKGKKSKAKKKIPPKLVTTTPMMTSTTTSITTTTTASTTTSTTTTTSTSTASTTSSVPKTTYETTTTTATTTKMTTPTATSPPTTTASTADTGAGGECVATNGKPCIFPFKDGNTEYNECKNHGGKYFWCATAVYESGKYKHWSYCPKDGYCPHPDGECRATNNMPCVFPFKDGKKEHNECADFGGKYFWCATGTNSAGKYTSWSQCPKDGSCPLPEKSTTPVTTLPATTASTTLLTTGTTTASNQMEKKVVDTLENLILGESRDDSLQMAHMLNKTLDTIIKDLEGEASKSGTLDDYGELPSASVKIDQDEPVRDGTRIGKGLMFDLSTVDSMKSVSRVSDDCCSDCKNKHSSTELAEYWDTLDACFCYKKKIDSDGLEVVPQTWASNEFTTKTCESSGCGYNSDVDPDRLLAEQNSAYLLNAMADPKYTDVFEVLNWNQGFSNPNINNKLFEDLENQEKISSGYYMMFLAPASLPCDKSVFDETHKSLFSIHINHFNNIKRAKESLEILVIAMKGKAPEWIDIVYKEINPHICMALQTTYFFVAMDRVQTLTAIFNFAFDSERYLNKFYPFKECSTKELTITAMKNIAEVNDGDIMFERSVIELYEWEALLPVVLKRSSANITNKTIVFIETETETADENDYIKYNGPVIFNKGQNMAVTYVHINKDDEDEIYESFSLILKSLGNGNSETNQNSGVKIVLKESQSTRMQTRGELPDSIEKLMTGSIKIMGVSRENRNGEKTGIDGRKINEFNKFFQIGEIAYLDFVIKKVKDEDEGKHDVVVFENKPMNMKKYDGTGIKILGQTMFIGESVIAELKEEEWHKKAIQAVEQVSYLPWMKGTITIRELTSDIQFAFTAQINGCGVRIFTIKNSRKYDGTYMSHDNNLNLKMICLSDDTLKSRLREADIIQETSEITFLAKVEPSDPSLEDKTGQKNPCSSSEDGKAQYAIFFNPKYRLLIGKSSVIAVRKKSDPSEWCLVLQRNIVVYDSKYLSEITPLGGRKGDILKNIFYDIDDGIVAFGNNQEYFDALFLHPSHGEEILVTRPFLSGELGYEMICNGKAGTMHKVTEHAQKEYWSMPARIVECMGQWKIFISDKKRQYKDGSKLIDLFNYIAVDSWND